MSVTRGDPEAVEAIRQRDFKAYCEWKHLAEDASAIHGEAFLMGHQMAKDWDDAVHVAAPWDSRVSLCGNWYRNLVALADRRPDGMAGCWTCLQTADWLDANLPPAKAQAA